MQHALGTGQHRLVFGRRAAERTPSNHNRATKLFFQRTQSIGQRRLRDVTSQRGAAKELVFVQRHQVAKRRQHVRAARSAGQVFLEIVMVGNLAEKSLDLAATVMATLRATDL